MAEPDPLLNKLRRRLGGIKRQLLRGPQAPAPAAPAGPIYNWSADGRELSATTPELPMHMMHVMYNDVYFTHLDHMARGRGFHQGPQGQIVNLIAHERLVYVRDDETREYFALSFAPVFRQFAAFNVTLGMNWMKLRQEMWGLDFTWLLWVPAGKDPVEIWDVQVKNRSQKERRISFFSHLTMKLDGTDLDHGELYRTATYLPEHSAFFVKQDAERHQFMEFPLHNGFHTCAPNALSWNANPGTFIGARRSMANPEAIEQGTLANANVALYEPTLSLHVKLRVPKNSTQGVRYVIGACDTPGRIAEYRAKYIEERGPAGKLETTSAAWRARCANYQFTLPEAELAHMLNSWVQQQIHMGATWSRLGWRGYRDVLQQAIGVAGIDAAAARHNIVGACAHQHADGFGVRGWQPLDDRRYSDGHAWLVIATTEYLKETGDFALLDAVTPFLESNAAPQPVYEHLKRALARYQADRGAHGLSLIFEGDWNDSMTGAGRGGRGESVLLSMLFCRAADALAELASWLGKNDDAKEFSAWGDQMRDALRTHAWDGEWWLCAYDDDGKKIGSRENEEGALFLIPQAMAQLARVCNTEQWSASWKAVEQHLAPGNWGLMLNWPAYKTAQPRIGRMSYMLPGHNENASVYTHGTAFSIKALLERGEADRALRALLEIMPGNPKRPVPPQPNVFFNGFYGPDSPVLGGLPDYAWFTGSASWIFWALTEQMLGLRRGYDGLRLQPCLPSAWREARITRVYRGCKYDVMLRNPEGKQAPPIVSITVDGAPHDPSMPLPLHNCQVVIELG